ncbi:MAG: HipA family kinase [Verrucomicrobium sp.]|nr:HipA family kinase [Verrucomicrobium sp.]
MTAITQILARSEQGMTRPFICKAGDQSTYYVKGRHAGLRSLCCEWVAGRLIKAVLPHTELSVPEFSMIEVPGAILDASARRDVRDLGVGTVFGSRMIAGGQELTWADTQVWTDETMALLILVDLWIQNEDRSLSELGGNPNLLTTRFASTPETTVGREPSLGIPSLWAYDFNLAFDSEFSRLRFFQSHVFGGLLGDWPEGFRDKMEGPLRSALHLVPEIFEELPLEWLHVDGDTTMPVQLDQMHVQSVLSLPFTESENFWSFS